MFDNVPKHQARALIVQEYGPEDVDAIDWLRLRKQNDPEARYL